MGRKVDVDHLLGAAEIAHRLSVSRAALIHDWRRRYADFPQPVLRLSVGLVWNWPEVERWARKTGRLGPPP